jgi:hypothetical protein
MKRFIYCALAILLTLALTACQKNNSAELEQQISSLQKEKDSLTNELAAVKTEKSQAQTERDSAIAERDNIKQQMEDSVKEKEVQASDVSVTFVDKVNHAKNKDNYEFSDRVNFHINIKNNTAKDIKGIQGVVDIQDLFGVTILSVNCDLVGDTIKPNQSILNKDLGMDINEFMDDHVKLYTTDYKDLKFVYTTKKIVFTDGTVKES